MKIALVSPYDYAYPGGVSAHISHLADNFGSMGHQVKIIAPSSKKVEYLENFIPLGRPFPVPSSGSVARVTLSLMLSSKVKRVLAEEGFDIVHLHEPLVPVLPITVLRFSRSVNVGTFHAYHGTDWRYLYSRRFLQRWFAKLHGRIAVSKPARDFVNRYFPGDYVIIPNGIEVAHFATKRPAVEEFCDGKLNILFVGRLEKRKGLNHLIRAYTLVKSEFPHSRLIVVGPDGGQKESLDKFIAEAGLKDVTFVGYVSYADLPRYYQTAHIFCAPATGQESFGIVLLEAMAAGKPIVASDIEGYASVLKNGKEGLLVEPKNEGALAAALARLLADPNLREEMGNRGKITATEYDWPRIAQRVMEYYESLLGLSVS